MIAPSGPFDTEGFQLGVAWLGERYVVRHREDIFARSSFLAGSDARRSSELREALGDPRVDAIVAARGGHGATRILGAIPVDEIAAANKLLVGFSDVTALHALWAQAGVRSLHGPMVATLGRAGASIRARWVAAVEGAIPDPIEVRALAPGRAEGPLVGGNLSVLAALSGTPFAPPLEGAILFLEDVNEAPYRVDRMVTTLRNAGWLSGLAGVALGAFTPSTPSDDAVGAMEAVLSDRLADLGIPVVSGVPSGHIEDNLELPLGAPVRIDAHSTRGTVTFLDSAVARKQDEGVG